MVSSRIEKRRSVSHRSALALNTQATSDSRTGIEHRPQGELGGPRSQPYNVWHQGKIVYFCKTREEAVNILVRRRRWLNGQTQPSIAGPN